MDVGSLYVCLFDISPIASLSGGILADHSLSEFLGVLLFLMVTDIWRKTGVGSKGQRDLPN